MSQVEMTAEEAFQSLTGFDEIAVARSFGEEITSMADKRPTMFVRALVFVSLRRQGSSDADAKQAALDMTLGAVNAFFTEAPEDFDPEEPDSEPGKDSSPPA